MDIDMEAFRRTLANARERLLGARHENGFWEGSLSSSALSTATAVCALAMTDREIHKKQVESGLAWLEKNQNQDGGFGDTPISKSNISTTTLCWAVFAVADPLDRYEGPAQRASQWIEKKAGDLEGRTLANPTPCLSNQRDSGCGSENYPTQHRSNHNCTVRRSTIQKNRRTRNCRLRILL